MTPNPYALLGGLLLILGAATGGYIKGRADANASWELQVAEKEREAHAKERQLQEEANAIQNKLQADNARIADQLANALERLRNRPERLPDATLTTCKGATGAELSRPDAGFLEREAARADRLRSALEACQSWAETVTE